MLASNERQGRGFLATFGGDIIMKKELANIQYETSLAAQQREASPLLSSRP